MIDRAQPAGSESAVTDQTVRILLAEDNDGDVYLVRRALQKEGLAHQLQIARNGEEALSILQDAENGKEATLPDLILLDLNLPRIDGGQVLAHIRRTSTFDQTPVIVLTSSDSPKDREMALGLGATLYFRKPTDLASFMRLGAVIQQTLRKASDSLS
jgi:chemotaxis family two-component system response regulator Rcp1